MRLARFKEEKETQLKKIQIYNNYYIYIYIYIKRTRVGSGPHLGPSLPLHDHYMTIQMSNQVSY